MSSFLVLKALTRRCWRPPPRARLHLPAGCCARRALVAAPLTMVLLAAARIAVDVVEGNAPVERLFAGLTNRVRERVAAEHRAGMGEARRGRGGRGRTPARELRGGTRATAAACRARRPCERQRRSRYAPSVIQTIRSSSPSGVLPTATRAPNTTRTQLPATSAPGAPIVPSHEAPGSRIWGRPGS